jgi:3-oxoacyl-[acyl-carrier protein] reductase
MNYSIKNKTALIGGSSKGLGKACALQLAQEGVNLVICARNSKELNKTAEEIISKTGVEVLAIPTDLSDITQIKELVDKAYSKFGNIDILVTNSGGPKPGGFFDLETADWDIAYHSVLLYIVELYRAIIPKMKENNWGRIINIVSLTVKEPNEGLLLSNVFRSGVVSLAKSISRDLISNNITINNICPAAFKTDRAIQLMTNQAQNKGISIEEVEENIVKDLPMKRFNDPVELSALAAFLCSENAKGITGTTIQVDGGLQKFIF